jgi:hypothetical protein
LATNSRRRGGDQPPQSSLSVQLGEDAGEVCSRSSSDLWTLEVCRAQPTDGLIIEARQDFDGPPGEERETVTVSASGGPIYFDERSVDFEIVQTRGACDGTCWRARPSE